MNIWYQMWGKTYLCQISDDLSVWNFLSSMTFPWLLTIFQSSMTFHDFSRKFYFSRFSRFSRPCGNPVRLIQREREVMGNWTPEAKQTIGHSEDTTCVYVIVNISMLTDLGKSHKLKFLFALVDIILCQCWFNQCLYPWLHTQTIQLFQRW